jgi:hypothetical protein
MRRPLIRGEDRVDITSSQAHQLGEFAELSAFWESVKIEYMRNGGLTPRQLGLFCKRVERDASKEEALRVDGKPVQNKLKTRTGRVRCADRAKPYCTRVATVVVGTFAFCTKHARSEP